MKPFLQLVLAWRLDVTIAHYFVIAVFLLYGAGASAAESGKTDPPPAGDTAPAAQTMDMSEVIALLQQQQAELSRQRKLLQDQTRQIEDLQRELGVLRTPPPEEGESVVADTQAPAATRPEKTVQMEEVATTPPRSREEADSEARESVARAQADDPSRDRLVDFPGAWRLPGTDAALRIGGYVKTAIVYNNDPLAIQDRFIVGSIPVGDTGDRDIEAQSSITAAQSRLNFDLRQSTDVGILRAFVEGDFAGDGDTFRLRHAFGQWDRVLIGKTWSAFMDPEASPEELDFEGLNGRINVRQPQVRIMPRLGEEYEFQFSLEDPNPEVENGQGVTRTPDLVASARFNPSERLHFKLSLIGREIRGQRIPSRTVGTGVEKKFAGGLSISGRLSTPRLDQRDGLLFQLNAGNGIGRYVNDLSSVGEFDAIFDPDTGDLKTFDILAGYASWQHWWSASRILRSNFTFGFVTVDNPDFLSGDAYKNTMRFSSNVFWSPTPRVEFGVEYLWGRRENEDGENGTATQIQVGARYLF